MTRFSPSGGFPNCQLSRRPKSTSYANTHDALLPRWKFWRGEAHPTGPGGGPGFREHHARNSRNLFQRFSRDPQIVRPTSLRPERRRRPPDIICSAVGRAESAPHTRTHSPSLRVRPSDRAAMMAGEGRLESQVGRPSLPRAPKCSFSFNWRSLRWPLRPPPSGEGESTFCQVVK